MAITLTETWQKVGEVTNKVTTNTTAHMGLWMRAVSYGSGHTVYGEIRLWSTNPAGNYYG